MLALLASLSPAHADIGGDWLAAQFQAEGSINAPADIATPYQSTAETLRLWQTLGESSRSVIPPALQFLDQEAYRGTEYLARLILAKKGAGYGVSDLVDELLSRPNNDGGLGEFQGYQSTALDSAFALDALHSSGYGVSDKVYNVVDFLLRDQQPDGGWEDNGNASSVYVTSLALIALSPYKSVFQEAPAAFNAARSFLLSKRDASGRWGEDALSALAIIALLSDGSETTLVRTAAEALQSQQTANGSWSDDVYTTALALRALALYHAGTAGIPTGTSGTITGYIVKANSHEPLANAEIALSTVSGYAVSSNSSGYFKMSGVPAGTQTLSVRKSGYLGISHVVSVQAGQMSDAGTIALAADPQTGSVSGHIEDGQDHAAIAGAAITFGNTQGTLTLVSDAGGNFDGGALLPGEYSVQIDKAGYHSVSGTLTVPGGAGVVLQQGLIKLGTYLDDTPGDIRGKVVDGESGAPLSNARFELAGGASAVTASDGAFVLNAVPRGAYQAQLSADGYQSQALSFVFGAGAAGDLGALRLYRAGGSTVATSLTLSGRVVDGVSGAAVNNATVTWVETGKQVQTAADGSFGIANIEMLDFTLSVAAAGYDDRTYILSASGYGELFQELSLPPAGGDQTATRSTLSGTIKNSQTGAAIAGAKVVLDDGQGLSVTTGSAGQFEFTGISSLNFALNVSAAGYVAATRQISLAMHGRYSTEIALEAQSADRFQVVSVTPPAQAVGANRTLLFNAEVANMLDVGQDALILGEIVDADGKHLATVLPYAPGTTDPISQFHFDAKESKAITIPWNTAQTAPGTYRLIVRVSEPGTVSRSLPFGKVLAENDAFGEITPSRAIDGILSLSPPLTQAGAQTPVKLEALLINRSNMALASANVSLSIAHPDTGAILHQVTRTIDALPAGNNLLLSFGDWTPTAEGNLPIRIRATDTAISGEISGTLYVGDKAAGQFTVNKTVVPEGTQTVQGKISLEGVDTAIGSAIDPLFKAVQNAVKTGGDYTANGAMVWQKSNRCLGCHIQTQSLVGVASAFQKRLGDEKAAINLYNTLASSQQDDGGLRANHPEYTRTQTVLGAWALTAWDSNKSFRTLYKAAKHLYDRRSQSGNQTWWSPDHASGWWYSSESHTALTVKAYAHLLKMSQAANAGTSQDYRLADKAPSGSGSYPRDMEWAPDGYLYTIKASGEIVRIDPKTNMTETVAKLAIDGYGIAVADDGTIYASGNGGKLLRRNPNGTIDILLSGGGYLTDVEIASDGRVYVVDYSNHRILRQSDSGQWETWAGGGLLNYPYGMTIDAAGNTYVANSGSYNIVKIDPAKTVSIFAEGLDYTPLYIDRKADGGFYYTSYSRYNSGQYTPYAINSLTPKGVVERLVSDSALLMGVSVVESDQVYVMNSDGNKLQQLQRFALDTSQLPNFRTEITRAVNYFLARSNDGTPDNIVQAMRLTGLAEARKVITDVALTAQVDLAMTTIANSLRARQRSDGGWGRYTGWGSDAMVTALVGLALDYIHPSANDPMVRGTIQYLLATQQGDYSWYSSNGILGTRLAATSLVVSYLPIALERLGGIDVDLHVNMPNNVNLSKLSIAPTTQTANAAGGQDYLWKLVGVTADPRVLDFDLTLKDLALHEQRAVADAAYIEFNNAFSGEKLRIDLAIPQVKAASELGLSLTTDRNTYSANEAVLIRPTVVNTGPTATSGSVEVSVRAAGGETTLATLAPLSVPSLASGTTLNLETPWNTGTTLIGHYEATARLLDTQGRLLDEATAAFQIVAPAALIDGRIVTDKPLYAAWDSVGIDARVENITPHAIQAPTRVVITVATPDGKTILNETRAVGELLPGALQTVNLSLNLADAVSGAYPVTMTVQDAVSRATLITRGATFRVERTALQALTGSVTANPRQVHQGDPVTCLDQAQNRSASALPEVLLTRELVRADNEQLLSTNSTTVNFPGSGQWAESRSIATGDLAVGTYACVLLAQLQGSTQRLGAALFDVREPPVKLDAALEAGPRGRVLVLLDAPTAPCDDDDDSCEGDDDPDSAEHGDDPHGPNHRPALDVQRAYLENLLKNAGWSYSIATDAKTFIREFHGGGYVAYLLLSEHVKLAETVQQELREAVNRGDGLVEAGGSDQRQGRLDEILGLKFKGKQPRMTGVRLNAGGFTAEGQAPLQLIDRTLRVELTGATRRGVFEKDAAVTTTPALAERAYGLGRAVFAGYDLLAEASLTAADARHGQLLLDALGRVHPAALAPLANSVYPLRLTVTNLGLATPGRAILPLPTGVTVIDAGGAASEANRLIWNFDLAKDAAATFNVWLQLQDAPVTFNATVESGTEGNYKIQRDLTLNVEPQQTDDLQAALDAVPSSDKAYRPVRKYLDWAQIARQAGDWPDVVDALRRAADALIPIGTPLAADIRLSVDRALRRAAMQLPAAP